MVSATELSTLSDEELFERIRLNDEQAFRVLYRRYDRRLYAYCLRVVRDPDLAQDVFQTVTLAIYEKRDSFTGGNFSSWLFTVARHAALKAAQKQTRELVSHAPVEEAEEIPADMNPEAPDTSLHAALQKSLAKLPQEFREPLELRYFQECSYEEISRILGINLSLTKVRIFRAKQMLQKHMSPYIQELQ